MIAIFPKLLRLCFILCLALFPACVGTGFVHAAAPVPLAPGPAPAAPAGSNDPIGGTLGPMLAVAPVPDTPVFTGEALEQKHEQVASKLRVAMLQEEAQQAASENATEPVKASETEVDVLKQLDVIIAQQKAASATLQDVETDAANLKLELSKLTDNKLDVEPPYSIVMLDQLRDSIRSLKERSVSLEGSIQTARDSVEQARYVVDEKKQALRKFRESNPDADAKVLELEIQLAEEILVLRRQELGIEEVNAGVRALQLSVDEKKESILGTRIVFSKATLDDQIAELNARELEFQRKAETLKAELQLAERRWLAARQEVDSTPSPPQEMLERVDALKTNQQTIQLETLVLNQRLQRFPMLRTAWERRFLVATGQAKREDRLAWAEETKKQMDQLTRERKSREIKIEELRASLAAVSARLDAANGGNGEVRRWLLAKQTSLSRQTEILTGSFLAIDTAQRTLERLQVQMQGERYRTLAEWLTDAWASVQRVWNYELTVIDDTSVTVGKIVSSVMFLFFGYFAARWISGWLGRRLPKVGVDEAGASIIESLSFYFLMVGFALTALRYANVPLTVFTFLGGALAIGIGFGSQNIVNNFISGLILLAERPIKTGDLIQLGEKYGNVVKIGARSTQIRTGENLDIIIPNSKFLENDVTNLTRRDDRLRTSISVGVAYGSALDRVLVLLEKAASDCRDVQDRPKPMVWFNDFGDNSLVFQVHFWIKARTLMQVRKVETEVRLNIDRYFRENDIVIAFPQRDLHIQTPRPIELRLTRDSDFGDQSFRAAS